MSSPLNIEQTVDIYCLSDMLPDMPLVSGRTALAHRLARRLTTPRGRFPFWPNFGTDLRQYLLTKSPARQIASAAEAECGNDEQVQYVSARAELQSQGRRIYLSLEVTDSIGPFVFTLSITEAAATLIELQNAA